MKTNWLRTPVRVMIGIVIAAAIGCQAIPVERNTVSMAGALSDMQYRQVMDNLALLADNPCALPHFAVADSGKTLIQSQGQGSIGLNWTLFTTVGTRIFDKTMLSSASPAMQYQQQNIDEWDTVPALDPVQQLVMRGLYLKALGLGLSEPEARATDAFFSAAPPPPLNDPNVRKVMSNAENSLISEGLPPGLAWSMIGYKPEYALALQAVAEQIAPAFVHSGCREAVPPDACYVSKHDHTYVWVSRNDADSMTHLTIAVLAVATTNTASQSGKSSKQPSPQLSAAAAVVPHP